MDNFLKKIVWLIIIAPAIYMAIVWNKIPATVPLHYNLKGEIDRYGSKNELLTVAAILMAVSVLVYLLVSNIYRIDPKKYAAVNKTRLLRMGFAISVFISAILCMIIYSTLHNQPKFFTRLLMAAIGLLFCILGNYMFTIKPNYFAGIRLPWTLESEDNWRKTHLLGGKLFFAGGFLISIISFTIPAVALPATFAAITAIITLIPCIYSFWLYKKDKDKVRTL